MMIERRSETRKGEVKGLLQARVSTQSDLMLLKLACIKTIKFIIMIPYVKFDYFFDHNTKFPLAEMLIFGE